MDYTEMKLGGHYRVLVNFPHTQTLDNCYDGTFERIEGEEIVLSGVTEIDFFKIIGRTPTLLQGEKRIPLNAVNSILSVEELGRGKV